MATARFPQGDVRRPVGSPRPKTRDNKDTLCRNVLIYGHCRYEESGCTFNHEQHKTSPAKMDGSVKKAFNADSPSFTPSLQPAIAAKKSTLSSQAANAAPFTPRVASATPSMTGSAEAAVFTPGAAREFASQQPFDGSIGNTSSTVPLPPAGTTTYSDPFVGMNSTMSSAMSTTTSQYNPYASSEHDVLASSGSAYFSQPAAFQAPLHPQYHLYAPQGPHRVDLQPWERATYDWFLPEKIREDIHKKTHATLQVLPNSSLPTVVDKWHSLVPIDTNTNTYRNSNMFGYANVIYKAQDVRNGNHYALRRICGYTLTNPDAVSEPLKKWRKIINAGVVRVQGILTTQAFGDMSLIFVYDYFPLSKTLAEHHFPAPATKHERKPHAVPENVLWSYVGQITNALVAIHGEKLAARCIELSKVILTGKNRIRLAACSVLDVLQYSNGNGVSAAIMQAKQQEDFVKFGTLLLSLAISTLPQHLGNYTAALNSLNTRYSRALRDLIEWLIMPAMPGQTKTVDDLVTRTSRASVETLDLSFQENDNLYSHLAREVENGRVARLMMKMMALMTDAEQNPTPKWSQFGGELWPLKLFRHYVFSGPAAENGTDGNGASGGMPPLGHIIMCLNKLDVGTDEFVHLTSEDGDIFILSYRELKAMFERAFNDIGTLGKGGQATYRV